MKSKRILIVDDEPKIVHLLAANLQSWGFLTRGSLDATSALTEMASWHPDLVLLDLMMPRIDGFETLRRIRSSTNVPVILVTARDQTRDKLTGFELGADDYVAKPFVLDELLARIHAVLRRSDSASLQVSPVQEEFVNGPLRLNSVEHRFWVGTQEVHLTNVEFKLAATLMGKTGAVMTHECLLARIWGAEHVEQLQWLRVAITRIRGKIRQIDPTADLIGTCHGVGYYLRSAD